MALEVRKEGGMTFHSGVREQLAEEKPKSGQELGLFLAFIGLLAWALFISLRGVNWPAVSHAVRALLAWIG